MQPETIQEDNIKLDTTGQYLVLGGGKRKKAKRKKEKDSQNIETKFFSDHAFYFLKHADRIFKDSRMFLAPVQVSNGLAYIGTNGFNNPTLGVYLEWWLNCKADVRHDKDGKDALTYKIAGSPLTGANACHCVSPDGTTDYISHYPFDNVWMPFTDINRRYNEAKQTCKAYSLQKVYKILVAEDKSKLVLLWHKLTKKVRDWGTRQ